MEYLKKNEIHYRKINRKQNVFYYKFFFFGGNQFPYLLLQFGVLSCFDTFIKMEGKDLN